MNCKWGWFLGGWCALSALACSAPTGGERFGEAPLDDFAEYEARREVEVARITQGLGEATCATTAPDAVRSDEQFLGTEVGNYDHLTCRDAYIVDAAGLHAGDELIMDGEIPDASSDPFGNILHYWTCGLHASWFYVYERQGNDYALIFEDFTYGEALTWGPFVTCMMRSNFTLPRDGDYRIILASRSFFGPKLGVSVSF